MDEKKKLFIFDFDGVLSIPYSEPEQHYPDVPSILKECSKHAHIAIASYNPVALQVLHNWGLSHLIITGRAGYNHKWINYDNSMRRHMTKHEMIHNIRYEDLLYHDHDTIVFFDDDITNIEQVKAKSNVVFTELIDPNVGITWSHVNKYLDIIE